MRTPRVFRTSESTAGDATTAIPSAESEDTPSFERVDEDCIDIELPRYQKIREQVQSMFGFDVKRYQAGAIADILEGKKDVCVIAGTGSGKSLIYQILPRLLKEKVFLVVCPTLALMGDQVTRLERLGVKAVALNSETLGADRGLWKEVSDAKFNLVLASPEVLLQDRSYFWETILRSRASAFCSRLSAIIVDECHLVWGWREFRKDYLGLGSLRVRFPRVTMIAMSATITPNVLSFVARTIGLRSGFHLYKQSIDRTNICQLVSAISKKEGYRQLEQLVVGTGAIWTIPKTMIFVDSIDCAVAITVFLRSVLPVHQHSYVQQVVRPFHASLEPFLRTEYLEAFREGDCRVLICTDAAGMGVDIPDIDVVVQWGIAEHLTLAMLWQRIGRAGRDRNLKALAIVFVFDKHLLPLVIPDGSIWAGFGHPVDCQNIEYTKTFVSNLYRNSGQPTGSGSRSAATSTYNKVDPPILWYLNTTGCRARSIMASFVDGTAFSTDPRDQDCCDNCMYNQAATDTNGLPKFTRHRFDITASTRYLQSDEYRETLIPAALQTANDRAAQVANKPSRAQRNAVRQAIDSWAFEHYGYLHRRIFLPAIREKLTDACTRMIDRDALRTVLDNAQFCLDESALSCDLGSLIDRIGNTLRDIPRVPILPAPIEATAGTTIPTLSPVLHENRPPPVEAPLDVQQDTVDIHMRQQEGPLHQPQESMSPEGPLLITQSEMPTHPTQSDPPLPLVVTTTNPPTVQYPPRPTPVNEPGTETDIPKDLPAGVTAERFLSMRQSLRSTMTLISDIKLPADNHPKKKRKQRTSDILVSTHGPETKQGGRQGPGGLQGPGGIEAARRTIDLNATRAQKNKEKRAMKEGRGGVANKENINST